MVGVYVNGVGDVHVAGIYVGDVHVDGVYVLSLIHI